jgi:hypothetical protein
MGKNCTKLGLFKNANIFLLLPKMHQLKAIM